MISSAWLVTPSNAYAQVSAPGRLQPLKVELQYVRRLRGNVQISVLCNSYATIADALEAEMTTVPIDRRTAVKLMAAATAAALSPSGITAAGETR